MISDNENHSLILLYGAGGMDLGFKWGWLQRFLG